MPDPGTTKIHAIGSNSQAIDSKLRLSNNLQGEPDLTQRDPGEFSIPISSTMPLTSVNNK